LRGHSAGGLLSLAYTSVVLAIALRYHPPKVIRQSSSPNGHRANSAQLDTRSSSEVNYVHTHCSYTFHDGRRQMPNSKTRDATRKPTSLSGMHQTSTVHCGNSLLSAAPGHKMNSICYEWATCLLDSSVPTIVSHVGGSSFARLNARHSSHILALSPVRDGSSRQSGQKTVPLQATLSSCFT
jgi:hypothetical protein